MEELRFSIVIPTRERPETLRNCLQTCINQELFDNYEIVISDNNSSPATKEVVDSFNNPKIKYFPTGKTLAMYENFEFAISKAKGEYIIVLGDDDGIILKGLYHIDNIIKKTNYKAISWQWIMYFWPEGVPYGFENIMYIPTSSNVKVVNGKQAIQSVIDFKMTYNYLPMLYINSAIHRDLIGALKSKTGSVFGSITPDSYSGMCMAYLSEYFLFLDRPMTIAGISGKSNGNNQLYKKPNNAINNEFNKLNDSAKIQFHKSVPNVRSINAIVSDVFMQANDKLFHDDPELKLDLKLMTSKILEDLVVFDKEEWYDNLEIIKTALNGDSDLVKWFDSYASTVEPRIKDVNRRENISTGLNHQTLVINGFDFNCANVYDVAAFYNKSLESEVYLPDGISFGNSQPGNNKKTGILIKIFRRLRYACRIIVKGS